MLIAVDVVENSEAVARAAPYLPRGADRRLSKERLPVSRRRVGFGDQLFVDRPPDQRVVLARDRLHVVEGQHVEDATALTTIGTSGIVPITPTWPPPSVP